MFVNIDVQEQMHPCVSDYGSHMEISQEICRFSTPSLPCLGSENELLFLANCDRDISSHLKTYGLSKCKADVGDEVDLLLCRAGEFNIIVLPF